MSEISVAQKTPTQWINIRAGDVEMGRVSENGDIVIIASNEQLLFIWKGGSSDALSIAFACLFLSVRELNAKVTGKKSEEKSNGGIIIPSKLN